MKPEISKRTQKIASAVYLLTGFFDSNEPLKWKLRNLSSDLISNSLLIKDNNFSYSEKSVVDLRQNLSEIESLFEVAKFAGLVSDANFNILSGELGKCLDLICRQNEAVENHGNLLLSKDYFNQGMVNEKLENPLPQKTLSQSEPKTFFASSLNKENKNHLLPAVEDLKSNKGQIVHTEQRPLKEFGAVAVKKNNRQSIIVNLLKRKKEIMIKDVSPLIEGCSEKTIQRELLNMVNLGILNKVGEKRWSKYSLAKGE